jgi:phenylpropionate dioxygenase-like ring-hydroxylating dioxygenase large terminal subunit
MSVEISRPQEWTSNPWAVPPSGPAGDTHIPTERYYSNDFFDLERQSLWGDTWQAACRLEDIPNVGDFTEYTIVDQSILIVRDTETSIRALRNRCSHRGVQLANGTGSFHGCQMVCPFHGWRYDLDGTCSYVYQGASAFAPESLEADALRIPECITATRWGLVFVNMNPDAQPLDTFLGGIAPAIDPLGLKDMRVNWWRYTVVNANWKVALEAFLEGYHIMQTHPEIAQVSGDDYSARLVYEVDEHGHGWNTQDPDKGGIDWWPARGVNYTKWLFEQDRAMRVGVDGWLDDWILDLADEFEAKREPDGTMLEEYFAAMFEEAARRGLPIRPMTPESSPFAFVFPNTLLTPGPYGRTNIYKFRPNGLDPESAVIDVTAVGVRPIGAPEGARPTREGPIPHAELPFVLAQDTSNMEAQQRGLRTQGFDHELVSGCYEAMIINFNRTLDSLIAD